MKQIISRVSKRYGRIQNIPFISAHFIRMRLVLRGDSKIACDRLLIFSRNGPIFSKAACKTRRMISSRRLTCSLKVIGMCSENSFSTSGSGFVQSVL